MTICSVTGCGRIAHARGWCRKHYRRWRASGDPLVTQLATTDMSSDERLRFTGWTVSVDGCWEWNGTRTPQGYGQLKVDGKGVVAHRLAYETWVGPIAEGLVVRHRCDNPPCINPEHLIPGTTAENLADRYNGSMRVFAPQSHESGELGGNTAHSVKVRERSE